MRYLENRHDVIFSAEGGPIWIKLCRLVQNDMSHAVIMVKIESRCRIPIWRTFGRIPWHVIPEPHATLQGVIIPSAILKIVFHHILFYFCLLMQFVLWRAAAFVSSPIHLYYIWDKGCFVLFTGWFHRCIRPEHSDASLMHRWNQPVNKTTHPKRAIGWKSLFLYPLHSTRPLAGPRRSTAMMFGTEKL